MLKCSCSTEHTVSGEGSDAAHVCLVHRSQGALQRKGCERSLMSGSPAFESLLHCLCKSGFSRETEPIGRQKDVDIYSYIYIYRSRSRSMCMSISINLCIYHMYTIYMYMCMCIYIYIHIHIYVEREKERRERWLREGFSDAVLRAVPSSSANLNLCSSGLQLIE